MELADDQFATSAPEISMLCNKFGTDKVREAVMVIDDWTQSEEMSATGLICRIVKALFSEEPGSVAIYSRVLNDAEMDALYQRVKAVEADRGKTI